MSEFICVRTLERIVKLESNLNITPHLVLPTKLCEQQFCLKHYVDLPAYNYSEQTVDIVNPPDIIHLYSDQALVSLRTAISDNNRVKFVLYITGGVQAIVPRSMA
jgi:hypothetical protein